MFIMSGIVASLVARPINIKTEQSTSAKTVNTREVFMPMPIGSAN
jgi:hypothetical protein